MGQNGPRGAIYLLSGGSLAGFLHLDDFRGALLHNLGGGGVLVLPGGLGGGSVGGANSRMRGNQAVNSTIVIFELLPGRGEITKTVSILHQYGPEWGITG
jgi:hypothetical protein